MKQILMIHEIRDWMFSLPLHEYTLTFDDGLFSQYYYLEKFKAIDTDKIFFISTGILCDENDQQCTDFPKCSDAHADFFATGNRKNYMKWSQAKEIYNTPNCYLGGHSHNHNRYKNNDIKNLFNELTLDTERMFEEFKKQDIVISKFCYPYNEQYVLYESILKKYSISEFYGKERIAIESLQ